MARRLPTLACLIIAACGGAKDANNDGIADGVLTPDSVSAVAPSKPIGSLSGAVLDSRLQPLTDASVTLNLGGPSDVAGGNLSTKTDAQGNFAFKNLPAGSSAQVTVTKEGYSTARGVATIPAAAGNFPINDGNGNAGVFALTQLNGTLKVQVVTSGGKVARGAKATLEVTPAAMRVDETSATSLLYGTPIGAVVVDGTADESGVITFTAIPAPLESSRLDGVYTVTISAYDDDNDGFADYRGLVKPFNAKVLVEDAAVRVLTLPAAGSDSALTIAASNVDSIIGPYAMVPLDSPPAKNFVKPGDSLFFVFNEPVLESSLFLKVTDESGVTPVATTYTLKSGNVLTVSFSAPLDNGKEYNLALRAVSADNGSSLSRAAYFFGADISMPKPATAPVVTFKDQSPVNSVLNVGETVFVTFNQPVKLVGGSAVEVFFDRDLNGDGTKGNAFGEIGYSVGYQLIADEPIAEAGSSFASLPSGYTTRYRFTYANYNVMPPFYPTLPLTQAMVLTFGRLASSTEATRRSGAPRWSAIRWRRSGCKCTRPFSHCWWRPGRWCGCSRVPRNRAMPCSSP